MDVSLVRTRENVVMMDGFGEVKTSIKTIGNTENNNEKKTPR